MMASVVGWNVASCHVNSNVCLALTLVVQSVQLCPTFHPPTYVIIFPVRSSPSVSSIDTLTSTLDEWIDKKERMKRTASKFLWIIGRVR